MSTELQAPATVEDGSPVWAIAELFPEQGRWSEDAYLSLPGNRLVELCDGRLEFLPMPTENHQFIAIYLVELLRLWRQKSGGGWAMAAPFPIRMSGGNFREPDVIFLRGNRGDLRRKNHWIGADLVVEVISRSNPERDLVDKRHEYAASGIPEYWIVDPRDRSVLVLRLEGDQYVDVERVTAGAIRSVTLDGFVVDLDAMFDAE